MQILNKEIEQETSAPAAKQPKVDGKAEPYGDVKSHVTGKTDIKNDGSYYGESMFVFFPGNCFGQYYY